MKKRLAPPDDVYDIMELADEIQEGIAKVLHGQPMDVAVSALMTAVVNMIASQEPDKERFIHYRNVLFNLFSQIIKRTK